MSINLLSYESIEELNNRDVLFGKGKGSYNSEGNRRMLALTARYYPHVGDNFQLKMQICKDIVGRIQSEGGRFVIQRNGKWYQVSEDDAIAKVEQQFRNRKNRTLKTYCTRSTAAVNNSSTCNSSTCNSDPQTFWAIQALQSAMSAVLREIDSSLHPPSRADREQRLLQDEGVRRAILEMSYTLPNTIAPPDMARETAQTTNIPRPPRAASSSGPVAANSEEPQDIWGPSNVTFGSNESSSDL
ncbi:MAG: hypothetical protein SGBAC_006187 [Bacillariaceae sp.]